MLFRALVVLAMTAGIARAEPDVSACCGKQRASLGTFFRGITLGQTTTVTLPSAEDLGAYVEVELEKKGQRIDGVVIDISDMVREPPLCPVLRDKLVKAWGPLTDGRWEARGHVVEFAMGDQRGCSLHFSRVVPRDAWLSESRRSVVPLWAIGKTVTELKTALAALEPADRDPASYGPSFSWHDIATDGTEIELVAYHARGRVIAIEVAVDGDAGVQAWQRLNALFGAPGRAVVHDDSQVWRWRRSPGIVLDNWIGAGTVPPPGKASPRQDLNPKAPFATHTTLVFGVKPPISSSTSP